QKLQRVGGLGARRRAVRLVGPVRHRLRGAVVRQALQRDRIPRTVPGESGDERAIVLGHPHGGVDVEPRVRPGEHAGGLLLIKQLEAHEEPEYGAAERLGQARGVVGGPGDEGAIQPEAAVGHEEVPVRMPVRPGAVRLQARDDPHGEVALAGPCANGGGHGAGGDAGDLAEQAAAVQTVGAEPLGDGEHHLAVRHRREQGRVQPLRPDRQPLGVTAGAEVAALAREREQILVRARVAPDAREAVVEHAAFEERVGHLRDHGAPRAVLACEALVV
ncbi:MAG: hypothetical protein AN485_23020, partial [Anabaena sp. MDT14b]